MGRAGGMYEAAPVPPGVVYPASPVRPHTSHARYRERERDSQRGYEQDPKETTSPAALGRPISLFDSDDDR